jgi:AraC-like DNA-binding protein
MVARTAIEPLRFVRGLHHPIEGSCPMHRHDALEVVFHPTGAGRTGCLSGQTLDFAEGDVVLYPPGFFHDQSMDRPGEDLCVQVELPSAPPPELRVWSCVAVEGPYARNELHLLSHTPAPQGASERAVLDLRVTALITHLLSLPAAGSPAQRAGDRLAERARRHIAEHCTALGSLDTVAEVCGCSPDRLRHAFNERYGISLVRWLGECRIERAKDLLLHAPLDLRGVAAACGYGTEQYFSACFRRLTGETPARWRDRQKPLLTPAS